MIWSVVIELCWWSFDEGMRDGAKTNNINKKKKKSNNSSTNTNTDAYKTTMIVWRGHARQSKVADVSRN